MKLSDFIEGLNTLKPYYKKDGYYIGAEHDQFHAYATERPLSQEDIVKMRRLGWFQPECDADSDDESDHELISEYDPEDGWTCFT